jgi:hypothetical protein
VPDAESIGLTQVKQYRMLKPCLGRERFQEHPSPLIRATRGLVLLKHMSLDALYAHSRALRAATEAEASDVR